MSSASIRAFVGLNGGGKTLAAVQLCVVPAVEEGRVIVGNLHLDVPDFKLLRSWRELVRLGVHIDPYGAVFRLGGRGQRLHPDDPGYSSDLPIYSLTNNRPALLVLDEITSCLPSRQAMSMPPQLQRILNQLRKVDVMLAWTAPNWARADLLLREVTQEVTDCRSLFPDRYHREPVRRMFPKALRDDNGKRITYEGGWRPRRLFLWRTYDAVDFEEFSIDITQRIRPLARHTYWRSAHVAQRMYRTLESVQLLDHLDDLGTCVNCGGRRSQAKCNCPVDHDHANGHAPKAAKVTALAARRGAE